MKMPIYCHKHEVTIFTELIIAIGNCYNPSFTGSLNTFFLCIKLHGAQGDNPICDLSSHETHFLGWFSIEQTELNLMSRITVFKPMVAACAWTQSQKMKPTQKCWYTMKQNVNYRLSLIPRINSSSCCCLDAVCGFPPALRQNIIFHTNYKASWKRGSLHPSTH